MSNLQKFNQILENIGHESDKLKDVSGAYQKLQRLIDAQNHVVETFGENNRIFGQVNDAQKVHQEKIAGILAEIQEANKRHKGEIAGLLEEKTDIIRKENKEFYKDLESTVKIKLEDNKSEIRRLIESERLQIKQIFEIEIAKSTSDTKRAIETEARKQAQLLADNHRTIKISVWLIGGLVLVLGALAVFKLWAA